MPVMNGHQATEAIRKAEAAEDARSWPYPDCRRNSARADRRHGALSRRVGMDDYLSKPISPEKLEAKIREWLPEEIAARIKHG
jgi:CheY-like chemotaxis protein